MAKYVATRLVDEYARVYGKVDDRTREQLQEALAVDGKLRFEWELGCVDFYALRWGAGAIEMRVVARRYSATVYWGAERRYALALTGEGWSEDAGEWREVVLTRSGHADTLLEISEALAGLEAELGLEDF